MSEPVLEGAHTPVFSPPLPWFLSVTGRRRQRGVLPPALWPIRWLCLVPKEFVSADLLCSTALGEGSMCLLPRTQRGAAMMTGP